MISTSIGEVVVVLRQLRGHRVHGRSVGGHYYLLGRGRTSSETERVILLLVRYSNIRDTPVLLTTSEVTTMEYYIQSKLHTTSVVEFNTTGTYLKCMRCSTF